MPIIGKAISNNKWTCATVLHRLISASGLICFLSCTPSLLIFIREVPDGGSLKWITLMHAAKRWLSALLLQLKAQPVSWVHLPEDCYSSMFGRPSSRKCRKIFSLSRRDGGNTSWLCPCLAITTCPPASLLFLVLFNSQTQLLLLVSLSCLHMLHILTQHCQKTIWINVHY